MKITVDADRLVYQRATAPYDWQCAMCGGTDEVNKYAVEHTQNCEIGKVIHSANTPYKVYMSVQTHPLREGTVLWFRSLYSGEVQLEVDIGTQYPINVNGRQAHRSFEAAKEELSRWLTENIVADESAAKRKRALLDLVEGAQPGQFIKGI